LSSLLLEAWPQIPPRRLSLLKRDQGSRAGVLCGRSLSKSITGGMFSSVTLQPIL